MGEPLPARVVDATWWHGGKGLAGYQVLANDARWDSAWIQLLRHARVPRVDRALLRRDSVRSLTFPSPWLKMSPTVYERQGADGFAMPSTRFLGYQESFRQELVHFHDCCVGEAECLTPPEQARLDTAAC